MYLFVFNSYHDKQMKTIFSVLSRFGQEIITLAVSVAV